MRKFLHTALFTLLFIGLSPLAAMAAVSLDDAKSQGLVGEDGGGYLAAVVDRPDKEVRGLIADVNEKRRVEYERIAAANGIAVEDVERVAGKKAIENTEPGQHVRLPGEGWKKK